MHESLTSVPTPRVFIDRARLHSNINRMQTLASKAGVRLRPHAKTHKSPAIAKWQIEAGAIGICCAKLGEAEVFADAGIGDIRMPYPVNPSNARRVLALVDRVKLSIIVDNLDVAREWSREMAAAGRRLDVLVKVDVGFHRCGVDPQSANVVDAILEIAGLDGLRFLGLLSHAGHAYHARSTPEILRIVNDEIEILAGLAAQLRERGADVQEISVGATPTARFIERQTGVTEMRPGNYVFFDLTQIGLGSATMANCAMGIVASVVSRPAPERVVFDSGSKTLTTDSLRGFATALGHGLVYANVGADSPDLSIVIQRLSEEHAVAHVRADCRLKPGDRVCILPNHACVVTNLTDELLLTDGTTIVDRLPVAARGKIW